jgi:hypothetical protein
MGYLLEPTNNMVGGLMDVGGNLSSSMNDMRTMVSSVRTFVSSIVDNIFGVFVNLIVELQRLTLSLKDMVGKMIGVMATILYVLDGSVKTMESAWGGPPGQMVKAIGSCFHPKQPVQLHDGKWKAMDALVPGDLLVDGLSRVTAVMHVLNETNEPLYILSCNNVDVHVTGSHYVNINDLGIEGEGNFVQVRNVMEAQVTTTVLPTYMCLITSTHRIPLGNRIFWDWEDDILT